MFKNENFSKGNPLTTIIIFIRPRSDHSLRMSLTDLLTNSLVEDWMNWSLPIRILNLNVMHMLGKMQNMQNMQNLQNIQNMKNMQNTQNVQIMQSRQNMQNMQNKQNMQIG